MVLLLLLVLLLVVMLLLVSLNLVLLVLLLLVLVGWWWWWWRCRVPPGAWGLRAEKRGSGIAQGAHSDFGSGSGIGRKPQWRMCSSGMSWIRRAR